MKNFCVFFLATIVTSCSTTGKITENKSNPLYEILTQQVDGGATIRFFEILSEPNEIAMLENDLILKNKIHSNDIQTANFIVCNLGEKSSAGYKIKVESVVETEKNVIITISEISPEIGTAKSQDFTTPYAVIKINSKKELIIK